MNKNIYILFKEYSHSLYLNMIYVDVNGPLTCIKLDCLNWNPRRSWCFWGFAQCFFLSLKPSVGNRFPASPFFYFSALLSRFSSVSSLSIPCLFKPLYFLRCDTAAQSFPTPSIPLLFFLKGTAFDFSRYCALLSAQTCQAIAAFVGFSAE